MNRNPISGDAQTQRDDAQKAVKGNDLRTVSLKMFGTTLFATGFSLVVLVFMSFLIYEGVWGAIVYQLFTLVIYTPILYMAAWRYGDQDRNYVQFGHSEMDLWRGTKIGLLAILPYILLLLVMLFSKIGILPDLLWLVRLFYSPFIVLFNLLVPAELAPDVPATIADASYWGILFASLLQLYVPVVTSIAYRIGYKGISLYHKLIYKENKKA